MVVAGRLGGVVDNGSVQGYRDDGVVLRTQKLGEADRIITLLTRHQRAGQGRRQGDQAHEVEVRRPA